MKSNFFSKRNALDQENHMIQQILNNFDFATCRLVMDVLNWKWRSDPESPTIEQLKNCSVELLKDAILNAKKGKKSEYTYYCSTGGLKASAWKNNYNQIVDLQLEFVLEEWSSDGDY